MEQIKISIVNRVVGVALCLLLSSCMTPEPIDTVFEGKPIRVGISFKSESGGLDVKGIGDGDLCAISIYCLSNKGYSRYAYGLFNTLNIGQVELIDNQKYKIECSIVKGGTSVIGRDSKGRYYEPFIISHAPCGVTGGFVFSSAIGFTNLYNGLAAVADSSYIGFKRQQYPTIDRYSAFIDDFVPSASGTIELYAKRTVFGITPIVDGFDTGVIEVELTGSEVITTPVTSTPVEHLICLSGNPVNQYSIIEDNYTENVNLSVRWVRDDGSIINITPMGGQSITVHRRHSYPLAIKIQNQPQSSTITLESAPLNIADSIVIAIPQA